MESIDDLIVFVHTMSQSLQSGGLAICEAPAGCCTHICFHILASKGDGLGEHLERSELLIKVRLQSVPLNGYFHCAE